MVAKRSSRSKTSKQITSRTGLEESILVIREVVTRCYSVQDVLIVAVQNKLKPLEMKSVRAVGPQL